MQIRRVNYFYTEVDDRHGKGYWLLEMFRQQGIDLIGFTAFPLGGGRSQLDFVTDDIEKIQAVAAEAGILLVGPKRAFIAQGEDKIGALVEMHYRLTTAGINAHAANGVADGEGHFGYILWVKPEFYDKAAETLGI